MSSKKVILDDSMPSTSNGNRFALLRDFEDDTDPSITAAVDDNTNGIKKAPKLSFPIKVVGKDIKSVQDVLIGAGIVSFLTKKMSIGTKIVCNSITIYRMVQKALVAANFQYYTHDLPTDKSFKVVLQGLDNKSPDDIKKALNDLQVKCTNVKVVVKKYDKLTEWLYIVYLENGSIRLHELREKVRSLFRTIVRWDFQRKIKGRLVQCRNCQMYGHGERGCAVKSRCANCSGCHKTAECKTPDLVLCINCKQKHKATDMNCQHRISYAEIRQKIQQRRKPNLANVLSRRNNNNFNFDANQFPTMRKVNYSNVNYVNNDPSLPANQSWASIVANNNTNSNSAGDLFTEEEITKLTFDVVMGLRNCKSKYEQFNVITKIAIKYLGCSNQQ